MNTRKQNITYTESIQSSQALQRTQTLTHTVSCHLCTTQLLGGGLNEEAQQEGAGHFKKLFQMF